MVSIRWYLGFLKGQLGGAVLDFCLAIYSRFGPLFCICVGSRRKECIYWFPRSGVHTQGPLVWSVEYHESKVSH